MLYPEPSARRLNACFGVARRQSLQTLGRRTLSAKLLKTQSKTRATGLPCPAQRPPFLIYRRLLNLCLGSGQPNDSGPYSQDPFRPGCSLPICWLQLCRFSASRCHPTTWRPIFSVPINSRALLHQGLRPYPAATNQRAFVNFSFCPICFLRLFCTSARASVVGVCFLRMPQSPLARGFLGGDDRIASLRNRRKQLAIS